MGTCGNATANFLATAALNVITDVTLLLLPIWLIWPLKLERLHKLEIIIVFMMGSLYVFWSL